MPGLDYLEAGQDIVAASIPSRRMLCFDLKSGNEPRKTSMEKMYIFK